MTCLKKEKEIELSLYNDVGTLASYNKYIEATKGDISVIYMDNAATTMHKPKAVIDAVVAAMSSMGNAGRGANEASLSASRIIYDTRERLAKLFGAENPKQIVFTMNSTESLNIAIKGLIEPGDHVITTMLEHNSVLRPLYEMEERGAKLTIIKADKQGNFSLEDMEAAITPKTKAIVCTNGSNLTGNYVDVAAVGEMAHRHGVLLIVDASQTAGVFPIDVQKMNCDFLAFSAHKMCGPTGIGVLYGKKHLLEKFQTYNKKHPVEMPTALEAGTLNGHGIAGMNAALAYLEETGIDTIREREQELMWKFYEGVKDIPNVTVYGDFSTKNRCAIVALNIGDYDSAEVSDELLTEYGISTRPGGHCAPLAHEALGNVEQGAVRFSFSHYNTDEEIETAIRAIEELAQDEE